MCNSNVTLLNFKDYIILYTFCGVADHPIDYQIISIVSVQEFAL